MNNETSNQFAARAVRDSRNQKSQELRNAAAYTRENKKQENFPTLNTFLLRGFCARED